MTYPIYDLHCDMLLYLATGQNRTPLDPCVRCSIPQMQAGNVKLQVLANFAVTEPNSTVKGMAQAKLFQPLLKRYAADLKTIRLITAIENSSAFSEEDEPLEASLERLETFIKLSGKPLYISLTWNSENRFGGGAHTQTGLKPDGKALLNYLSGRRIAIDLSHTSDRLAEEIFKQIDQQKLQIPVIASHSNFRSIKNVARNLPDELALEIKKRNGVIGMNFIRAFLGEQSESALAAHLEHALKLGLEEQICFGADWFYEDDVPESLRQAIGPGFFEEIGDASVYPAVLQLWKKKLGLSHELAANIAHKNAARLVDSLLPV